MNESDSLPKQPVHTRSFFSACVPREVPSPATRSRCCSSQPAGYTLIEILATLSLLSTLAIASVTIINTLTKDGIESAHGRQSRRDVHRLASSLREDSTRTASLSPGNLNWPVKLTHESSQTVYDWNQSENSLTRTEIAGQSPVLSERFLLPKGSKPEMAAGAARLTLRISLPGENHSWIIEGNLKDGSSEQ
ncbi:MAG: prepilin-type N-terminal cleavage/methylation domain-containing protein [Rubripirellula sp.]